MINDSRFDHTFLLFILQAVGAQSNSNIIQHNTSDRPYQCTKLNTCCTTMLLFFIWMYNKFWTIKHLLPSNTNITNTSSLQILFNFFLLWFVRCLVVWGRDYRPLWRVGSRLVLSLRVWRTRVLYLIYFWIGITWKYLAISFLIVGFINRISDLNSELSCSNTLSIQS